jgi:hypothetical protein
VLHGLPPTAAHKTVHTDRRRDVKVAIVPGAVVRGRVLDATDWRPLAGVLVWCGEQDAVRTDASGRFELVRLLPGDVDLRAQKEGRRRRDPTLRGRRRIVLEPGREYDDIDISIGK